MGYYAPDPYYQPEDFGLTSIGEVSWDNEFYQFDLTAVWRNNETGVIYYADDSGCSCPSPFEDFHDVSDLTETNISELSAVLYARRNDIATSEYFWDKENLLTSIDSDIYEIMNKLMNYNYEAINVVPDKTSEGC